MAKKPYLLNKYSMHDLEELNRSNLDRGYRSNRFDERRRSFKGGYLDVHPGMSRASSTESLLDDISTHATSLFHQLDSNHRGFINKEDLIRLNSDLSEDDLIEVFRQLDQDKDGCINVEDFKMGLKIMNKTLQRKKEYRKSRNSSLSNWSPPQEQDFRQNYSPYKNRKPSTGRFLDEETSVFSCQEKICDFYEKIEMTHPELAEAFNDVFESIVNDVKDINKEKQIINEIFQREKLKFDERMNQLEEEFESQIQLISNTETRQEVEKIEKEFIMAVQKKEQEIHSLKERGHELEEELRKVSAQSESNVQSIELKDEVSRLMRENNSLQVQLSTAQTECSMTHSEKVTMKKQMMDKITQLQHERSNLRTYEKDWMTLTKQLQTLREINRQLQDTNDNLRSAIESSSAATEIFRKLSCSSVTGLGQINTDVSKLKQCDPAYVNQVNKPLFERFDSCCPPDSIIDEHGDSGLSTLRDVAELESEIEPVAHATLKTYKFRPIQVITDDEVFVENPVQHSTHSMERTMVPKEAVDDDGQIEEPSAASSRSSRRKGVRSKDRLRTNRYYRRQYQRSSEDVRNSESDNNSHSKDIGQSASVAMTSVVTSSNNLSTMPEIIFKIAFAGDASVGKSTFMMRLCTNSFVTDIQATLGIDFRNKTINIDNKNVGLQLWDTAGQERFRSMTASYFRKADGVLLLYDTTYDESFIHVREWVENIRGCAGDDIPIMLVGNKTDLRDRYSQEGRRVVTTELGSHLAKENKMIFIETSARSGNNVQKCIEELTRNLIQTHNLHTNTSLIEIGKKAPLPKKSSPDCCGS